MSNVAIAIKDLENLKAKEKELRAKKAELKAAQGRQEWETKTKERNPQYVVGSLRPACDADKDVLAHVHGWVCLITCSECGKERVVNKQDAFQARFCKEHAKAAKGMKAKERRLSKKLEGKSAEEVQAEIAALEARLAELA